ncbi:MAG: hypothetical protein AB8I08_23020 [Sandaracinaceae bacterium]
MRRRPTARAITVLAVVAIAGLATTVAAQRGFGPRALDQEAVATWIAERVRRAESGRSELVRLPLVLVSDGWGCPCPDHYVGNDPDTHAGASTWLRVELAAGVTLPTPPTEQLEGVEQSLGTVLRVDGHFTGEVVQTPEELGYTYRLHVFRVTRVHGTLQEGARSRFRVAVLGPHR